MHLKKEKKNQHNSIQFPYFKEFSVLENWKGARDVYTAPDFSSDYERLANC